MMVATIISHNHAAPNITDGINNTILGIIAHPIAFSMFNTRTNKLTE